MSASFLHLVDHLPSSQESSVLFALLVGIAYFVGLATQDLFSLLGLVTTATVRDMHKGRWSPLKLFLYRQFNRDDRKWRDISDVDIEANRDALSKQKVEDALERLERIVTLKQVGTTGGPCCLVAAVLLLVRYCRHGAAFDGSLCLAAVAVGVPLVVTSWIRGGQQAQFLAAPPIRPDGDL